ncbi:Protein of unknown function [Cotesia congregata]|uniref:Endonuclease/exonuclease/phosphatase domain-containing protein n=1 Tax=Cotesia congregata TaxID=51543 RepID=A0A8J2MKC0_COTCN|nr:Protein of unknown function [Cotesia congregata]
MSEDTTFNPPKTLLIDKDNVCCRGCNAKIIGKTVTCPQCNAKYHPSCALLTGTNSSGAFTRCCSRRPASPLPFSIEALKESIIEEFKGSLQDIIVTSVNTAIGPIIQSTMQPQISSLKRNLEDTVNKHISVFNEKLSLVDAKLSEVQNSIAANTSVLAQRVGDIESRLANLDQDTARIDSRCDNLKKDLEIAKLSPSMSSRNDDHLLDEIEERDKRKKNIIVYGLPEDKSQGPCQPPDSSGLDSFTTSEACIAEEGVGSKKSERRGEHLPGHAQRNLKDNRDLETNITIFYQNSRGINTKADRISSTKRKGGGVLFAIKLHISATQIPLDHLTNKYEDVDAICIRISSPGKPSLILVIVYIAPDIGRHLFDQFFDDITGFLSEFQRQLVVLGDFNAPAFCNCYNISVCDHKSNVIRNWQEHLGLSQFNSIFNINQRCLDLVFLNIGCLVEGSSWSLVNPDNHHPALVISLKLNNTYKSKISPTPKHDINFSKLNTDLINELVSIEWNRILPPGEPNVLCATFYDTINSIFKSCTPTQRFSNVNTRTFPPWFSSKIKSDLKLKESHRLKFKRTGSSFHYQQFVKLRISIKSQIAAARLEYIKTSELNFDKQPSAFWSLMKKLRSDKNNTQSFVINNQLTTDLNLIAESFADYFGSVFFSASDQFNSCPYLMDHLGSVELPSCEDVFNSIQKLPDKWSAGIDVIYHTDLGVTFDNKLTFQPHINKVLKGSWKMLGFVTRSSRNLHTIKAMKSIYYSLLRSRLEYASIVWSPIYDVYSNKIDKIQKKFLKFLLWRTDGDYPDPGSDYVSLCRRTSRRIRSFKRVGRSSIGGNGKYARPVSVYYNEGPQHLPAVSKGPISGFPESIPPINSSKLAETSHRTTIDDHRTDTSLKTGTAAITEQYDVTGTTKSTTDDCRRVASPTKDEPKCLTTGRGPSVHLRSTALRNGGVNALLDTGSDLNLLCIEELHDEALCNIENTGVVGGIATSSMPLTGSINLKIFGVKITFHLVPEPPGGYRAILGNEFFIQNRVTFHFIGTP